jgi:glycosyltransferase involved in cell wall biosynthesis
VKASVIVVSYNRARLLLCCVKKLLCQNFEDYQLIVIDDGSTDETPQMMEKIKNPKLTFIRYEENKGQPFVRNKGIEVADGEIIIFVDSDVLVEKNFVRDHVSLQGKRDKLIVQGLVRHIRKVESYGKFTLRVDGLCLAGLVTQNVSVKKKYLEEVGGLDTSFGTTMGYEDIELGRRLREMGFQTVYAWRSCLAWHVDGYNTNERLTSVFNKSYQFGKNAVLFSKMYGKNVAARHLKKNYVYFINTIFGTRYWIEDKGIKYLFKHRNSLLAPFLKELIKYHYRGKGIREALCDTGKEAEKDF